MTRHVADAGHSAPTGARVRQFLTIERRNSPGHPASRMLWRKPVARPVAGRRVQEFLRIARGRTV